MSRLRAPRSAYNTGTFAKQLGSVVGPTFRHALPGGATRQAA